MPEKLIYLEEIGHAFITKSDDDNCPKGGLHDFSSAVLTYLTRRGEYRHINQDKYLMPGSTRPRPEHWRMRIAASLVESRKGLNLRTVCITLTAITWQPGTTK